MEHHLALMDRLNIAKSILSISSPGTYLTAGKKEDARNLTRSCNDYAAGLVLKHPSRLAFWASLPLPDIEGSLVEISHVLDALNANGVTLETNHHGFYLGDSIFDPIFDELNRRHAKVFINPTTACVRRVHDQCNLVPATPLTTFPNPVFEFLFDTARAVINLFVSGTISRCPNIIFVIPHAGGALPPLIERFTSFGPIIGTGSHLTSRFVKETFSKQFYFDLAGFPFPDQIHGLLKYVKPEKLLYGTDYPFTPESVVLNLASIMRAEMALIWSEPERQAILYENATRLL